VSESGYFAHKIAMEKMDEIRVLREIIFSLVEELTEWRGVEVKREAFDQWLNAEIDKRRETSDVGTS